MVKIGTIYWCLLLIVCLVGVAKADGWDDFSNNLATDLAPLIALFGEQATKQFLSESTTRLDSFIFAMAPLGIITAIVSVIRVCGGASLRAFIGRAQEGGGIAEAELCSSTSRDVCELYHNGAIVRVFGRPKILEIVHDRNATIPDEDIKSPPECGIYSFQDYIEKPLAKDAGWEEIKKDSQRALQGDTEAQPPQSPENNDEQFAPNPNLSFNIGIREQPNYILWLAAIIAFSIQAAAVVFGYLATYIWRWTKDNARPPGWAFPLMFSGTLLLDGGMFSCAFLIDNSTKERVFRRTSTKRKDVQTIYVVQPGNQIVGDQTFDAFLFTDASHPLTKYTTSRKSHNKAEVEVFLAAIITLVGFVLQFLGLRAMHSSVAVFQLGAILLVSIIRAGLRTQRLAKEQNLLRHCPDEVEGHELDWLALQMAKDGLGEKASEQPEEQQKEQDDQYEKRKSWAVLGGPLKLQPPRGGNANVNAPEPEHGQEVETRLLARRAFFYRSRLAELTSQPIRIKSKSSTAWDERLVQARQQARQLKQAIESSASVLFSQGAINSAWQEAEVIPWALKVADYDQPRLGEQPVLGESSTIYLSLHRAKSSEKSTAWEVNRHYLEAVIGLWTWSIISDFRTEMKDEFGLRTSEALEVPASRILAIAATEKDIRRARRELEAWIDDFPLSSIEKWGAEECPIERHPSILWGMHIDTPVDTPIRNLVSNSPGKERLRLYGWQTTDDNSPDSMLALTTPVDNSISATCAHDIYQSFLWAVIEALDSIGGETKSATGSRGFLFTNEVVARLVECFKESGLGSTQDAYLVIIPTLQSRAKLPAPTHAIRSIHTDAENKRKRGNFQDAEDALKLAWQIALHSQNNGLQALTMLEFGELYRDALFQKNELLKDFARTGITWMEEAARENHLVVAIVDRYARLEFMSRHNEAPETDAELIIDVISKDQRTEALWRISHIEHVSAADIHGRTILSWAAQQGWPEIVVIVLDIGYVIDDRDKSGRTALSYAAEHGNVEAVEILLRRRALPLIADSSYRTPLSYAAGAGHDRVMKILLDDTRVGLLTKDNGGRSPLHWAARNGHNNVITLLLQYGARVALDELDESGHSALIVALLNSRMTTAEWLVKNGSRVDICVGKSEAWIWAVQHGEWLTAAFLLRQLNRIRRHKKAVVITIATEHPQPFQGKGNSASEGIQPEIMVQVLAENGMPIAITMETVRDVAASQYHLKVEICDQEGEAPKSDSPQTSNEFNRDWPADLPPLGFEASGRMASKLVRLLLDRIGKGAKITEEVVRAAAGNCAEVTAVLLDQRGEEVKITEGVIQAIVEIKGHSHSNDVDRRKSQLQRRLGLTEPWDGQRLGREWRDSFDESTEILTLLLSDRLATIEITEEMVKIVIGEFDKKEIKMFLHRGGKEIEVTTEVARMVAIKSDSVEILRCLLDGNAKFEATEEFLTAVVGQFTADQVKVLLDQGEKVRITESIVQTAAKSIFGKGIVELFLDHRPEEAKITESVVQAAASNPYDGGVIRLLLERWPREVRITENIVQAAASNVNGEEIIMLLLDERGKEVAITENIVRAAASNENGGRIIALLLRRRGNEVKITETILQAAASNEMCGKGIMPMLLEFNPGSEEVKITEKVVQAAASNINSGEKVLKLLLDRRGSEVTITENIVKAATKNEKSEAIIKLLFDRRGKEFKITGDIVQAVAGKGYAGNSLIDQLLDSRGDEIIITEQVVLGITGYQSDTDRALKLLLDGRARVEITKGMEDYIEKTSCYYKDDLKNMLNMHWKRADKA